MFYGFIVLDEVFLENCDTTSIRHGGPSCSNVAARGGNELLSTASRVSVPHRESTSDVVRLFAAQLVYQSGRVCRRVPECAVSDDFHSIASEVILVYSFGMGV